MDLRTVLPAAVAISLLISVAGNAQDPSSISYLASVKLNTSPDPRGLSEYSPGGRYTATAVTVATLLRTAYRIQDYQLVGAPAWISTKRYDIAAKVDDSPAPTQQVFLRALLKDRFNLVVRSEARELPIFALVLARSDGKLGPQLIKSDFDCAAYAAGPHPLPQPGKTPPCATATRMGALSGKAIPMTQLATTLAFFVHRFTVDKTGLVGGFDVELTWTPETTNTPDDSGGLSIFTAAQEQLGLKLVSDKGPVDVLVVDRVAEPSEN
jgi:uncharacterized protein (TIGR03435 family)